MFARTGQNHYEPKDKPNYWAYSMQSALPLLQLFLYSQADQEVSTCLGKHEIVPTDVENAARNHGHTPLLAYDKAVPKK